MHIHIPEPEIRLYEDGFDDHDLLNRKKDGERLSELVGRIDDPLVIALDGAWGSGKTVFLKCWVGEHLKRKGDTDLPVYFDAFRHDYMDDPLISLVGAIGERIEKDESKLAKMRKMAWEGVKKAVPSLARVSLAVATHGATEIVGKVVEKGSEKFVEVTIDAASKETEKAIDAFWTREQGRRTAMQEFRNALTTLTEPDEQGTPTRKLIIVIDELDRCRPDYALSLLEVIKHFFAVPGVHFVLGTHLPALENSVRARYGAGIDAAKYLQKFFQITMRLSPEGEQPDAIKYLEESAGKVGVELGLAKYVEEFCTLPAILPRLTLRDIERILTRCALLPYDFVSAHPTRPTIVIAAIFLETLDPGLYRRFRQRNARTEEMVQFFFSGMQVDRTTGQLSDIHPIFADLLEDFDTFLTETKNQWSDQKHTKTERFLRTCLDQFTLP